LDRIAERLTREFGKGFDASNLYKMSQFYRLFPKLDALRPELSWTHFRLLLRLEDPGAREWYMNEAAAQNWGTRALERQIGTLYVLFDLKTDELTHQDIGQMDMYVRMYAALSAFWPSTAR